MTPPRRVLVVTYFYPPSTAVGGARWAAMARHLRAMGHEVTIITSTVHGELPGAAGADVVRTWDLANAQTLRRAAAPSREGGARARRRSTRRRRAC